MRGSGKTGIIPAYARNTRSGTHRGKATQDHPRLRGEHRPCSPCRPFRAGSSPLTRGTRQPNAPRDRLVGIIPAYAGNTRRSATSCSPRRDHPRLRGEHAFGVCALKLAVGSSPLTRGTHRRTYPHAGCRGIIPAYAGNTPTPASHTPTARDHPRLREEHRRSRYRQRGAGGSSPLTRGTHLRFPAELRLDGIIPAYAGNTRPRASRARKARDHPRLRGEHYLRERSMRVTEGSSPLTRGTLALFDPWLFGLGIIPAYAGNTGGRRRCCCPCRDHPRLRGEHRAPV